MCVGRTRVDTLWRPCTSRAMPSTRTDPNLVISRTETFVLPREAAGLQPALRDWAEARVHIKVVDALGDSPTITLESDVRSERVVLTVEEAVGLLDNRRQSLYIRFIQWEPLFQQVEA